MCIKHCGWPQSWMIFNFTYSQWKGSNLSVLRGLQSRHTDTKEFSASSFPDLLLMALLCHLYRLHFTIFSQLSTYSELLASLVLILFSLVHSNSRTDSKFRCEDWNRLHFLGPDNRAGTLDQVEFFPNIPWSSHISHLSHHTSEDTMADTGKCSMNAGLITSIAFTTLSIRPVAQRLGHLECFLKEADRKFHNSLRLIDLKPLLEIFWIHCGDLFLKLWWR